MQIFMDRPSRIYSAGEKAVFHLSGVRGKTEAVFSLDGEAVLEKTIVKEDAVLSCGLDYPGVLRCTASGPDGKKVFAGAAFDPEKIRPVLPEPEDFQPFWEHWKSRLSAIPEEFRMEKRSVPEPGAEYYDLTCRGIRGTKVYAYLRLPVSKKKVPLFVYVEGAGRGQNPETFLQHCATAASYLGPGTAVLTISVHDWKAPETDAEHKKKFEARQKKNGFYWLEGLGEEDPSKCFFLRAVLGAMRMCGIVSALPQIDPDRIAYLGLSQGGAFGIYLTALCPRIRACFSGVPAFGDAGGFLLGHHTTQSCVPEFRSYYEKLRYYDIANFAKYIRVPVFMSAGLIDTTCPPSSVYAVYNSLTCRKMFYCKPEHGHCDGPEDYTPLMWSFLKAYL